MQNIKKKKLGTFGDFGTFSFFYSHQITSGEGGMIVCNDKKDYEILVSLRSHGWSRGPFYEKIKKQNPSLDPRYIFFNSGFNLRPTDIQASIGHSQFKRLDSFIYNRKFNKDKIINSLTKDKRWNDQFSFIEIISNVNPSYMVLPFLINEQFKLKKKSFIKKLEKFGIETRPVISGSFINQPASKLYNLNTKKMKFEEAQKVQDLGFVIGLHTKKLNNDLIKNITDGLFLINDVS